MKEQQLTASPIKLRSGEWGARVQGSAVEGASIKVTTRAGKSWQAFVSKVVWSGSGITIVSTRSLEIASDHDRPKYRHDDDDEMFDPGACWDAVDEVDEGLSTQQLALQESLASRKLDSHWHSGLLTVSDGKHEVTLTFDFAPELEGAAIVPRSYSAGADMVARIAFFEALRIGDLDEARDFVKECEEVGLPSGAPDDWKDTGNE